MKHLVAILLSFLLLAPGIMKTGVLTWYQSQKEEIAAKFCVNKDQPNMKCEGRCHMKKTMQSLEIKIHKNGNDHQPEREIWDDVSAFVVSDIRHMLPCCEGFKQSIPSDLKFNLNSPYIELLSPPPEC